MRVRAPPASLPRSIPAGGTDPTRQPSTFRRSLRPRSSSASAPEEGAAAPHAPPPVFAPSAAMQLRILEALARNLRKEHAMRCAHSLPHAAKSHHNCLLTRVVPCGRWRAASARSAPRGARRLAARKLGLLAPAPPSARSLPLIAAGRAPGCVPGRSERFRGRCVACVLTCGASRSPSPPPRLILNCFFYSRVLTPLQLSQASVFSFPLFPDVSRRGAWGGGGAGACLLAGGCERHSSWLGQQRYSASRCSRT